MTVSTSSDLLANTLQKDPFSAADRAFVRFLTEEFNETDERILLASALALASTRDGHSYLDLALEPPLKNLPFPWPSEAEWASLFTASPVIGGSDDSTPLVFAGPSALYLRKYFDYESTLAQRIIKATGAKQCLPTQTPAAETDLQALAVKRALENRFFIISGGPGTGKTTTVLDYITQYLDRWKGEHSCRIAAVAPTGKAAARLSQSIQKGLSRLSLSQERCAEIEAIPCMTIHRLLGSLPNRANFRHNEENPINYEVLVIDEASMIDLPLMEKLFAAIPETCSTVLLGDRNQLSSVEVGSVFGDLLQATETPQSPVYGKSVTLTKTYRFSEDSSIHRLCEGARTGDVAVLDSLLESSPDDFEFQDLQQSPERKLARLSNQITEQFNQRLSLGSPSEALDSLNRFITLAPLRQGPFGTTAINHLVDSKLRRAQNLDPDLPYAGMPIIVMENNYDLKLFNGDVGVVWQGDSAEDELKVYFAGPEETVTSIPFNWLPSYELAYALTIHKSQGSEFDEVAAIFPTVESALITRELLYTCTSRAKTRLSLYADPHTLVEAIKRPATRATRLEGYLT